MCSMIASPSWPGLTRRSTASARAAGQTEQREVVLFADTFNRYFERENLDAALAVLTAGGYRVHVAKPADGSSRPLCCGRTFLSVGQVDEAREEAERTLAALDAVRRARRSGRRAGAELPAELPRRGPGDGERRSGAPELAAQALTFEEFLAREAEAGRLNLPLKPIADARAGARPLPSEGVRRLRPGRDRAQARSRISRSRPIESSCCGMAGSFGYAADTIDVSLAMGELSLLPAVRKADADTLIVADGTSCRHQIHDGAGPRGAACGARAGDELADASELDRRSICAVIRRM